MWSAKLLQLETQTSRCPQGRRLSLCATGWHNGAGILVLKCWASPQTYLDLAAYEHHARLSIRERQHGRHMSGNARSSHRSESSAVASYGDDAITKRVANRLREIFDSECNVFFVFNGTAANSLAVSTCCQPYHSVICADVAHLETDECG